jgi:glycosyltransferase involved in cell wall biosynthesis
MKILVSALACSPGAGSEPATGWHMPRALADFGHEVTVLVMANYRDAILAAGPKNIDFRFIDIPDTPVPGFAHILWTADIYRRWQREAYRHIVATHRQFDVTHHLTWGSLHLGSELWRLPAPLVYGPIGGGQTAPAGYWRYFGREWPAEAARTVATRSLLTLNGLSKRTLSNSRMVLVDNSATAAACRRLGARDVRYMLSYGLPDDWVVSPRPQPSGTPVILWVGRLIARKAPVLAVQAFAELRRTMQACLVIAGDGPLREEVLDAARRLGVSGDVEVIGQVSWGAVKPLYDSASVLLFSSLRESFGAPVLEALGRGLPVAALDLHGIADADVGAAAIKVPLAANPADLPSHLADAMRTVLSDGEWEARSKVAVDYAAQWVWSAKAAAATRIYEEVAADPDLG